jgi:urea transport system permease protein
VALGGRGTLVGPVVGAVSVNALKSWATRAYPDMWLLILGGSFVLVVMFMPKGIIGIPAQVRALIAKMKNNRANNKKAVIPETDL